MPGKTKFIFRFFILGIFFGILYLLNVYSPIIKSYVGNIMNKSTATVAGVKTGSIASTPIKSGSTSAKAIPPLPEKIKTDISNSINNVKKNSMNIKIKDILGAFARLGNVVKDVEHIGEKARNMTNDQLKKAAKK